MIKLNDVSIKKGGNLILDKVSLDIKKGDKIFLKGESGSGKSTLLKTIMLFEKTYEGTVDYEGAPVDKGNVAEYRRKFVYIAQNPPHFEGSGLEFLKLPLEFKVNSGMEIKDEDIENYMRQFDLPLSKLDDDFMSLSGGEKQRFTIIQALLLKKSIFLLDEITSAIDKEKRQMVVKQILSDEDRTVVVISHDDEWYGKGMRVVEIKDGKLKKVEE